MQSVVNNLIIEEMRLFGPRDYLSHLPPVSELKFEKSEALKVN